MAEICLANCTRVVVACRIEPRRRRLSCFFPKTSPFARTNLASGAGRVLAGPYAAAAAADRGLGLSEEDASSSSRLSAPLGLPRTEAEEEKRRARDLDVAVRAVQLACSLCQRVQSGLVAREKGKTMSKEDNSPVTVADWGVQALVSWLLSDYFGGEHVPIVAEEDASTLLREDATVLLESVTSSVNECLSEAPRYGLKAPPEPLEPRKILDAIRSCNSTGGSKGRFWVLDPVDGTLGFVRGDQYAVALALIEDGDVVLGALGCPNYPSKKEWLNYHQRYYRLMTVLSPPAPGSWHKGCVMYARKGTGEAWMQPLVHDSETFDWHNSARMIHVSSISDPASATFCEPVEKANSSHSFTAGLASSVGLRKQPLRVYSMVKYAAIARGDAEIFMKFARAGYKEKVWDHAAGSLIIQEAGGVVTDAGGRLLDFSKGIYLEGLDRGIIACSGPLLHEKILKAVDASWDSSNL
ncbi:3',5'-bisphosphate nucleotidase AHL-like [Curcuma longa]|uniref:3',5'-bisphosphate nucleotidase AHL-like n=1 Tax=Curcuma longa TaxID=136217 RepID=UPI003D9E5F22